MLAKVDMSLFKSVMYFMWCMIFHPPSSILYTPSVCGRCKSSHSCQITGLWWLTDKKMSVFQLSLDRMQVTKKKKKAGWDKFVLHSIFYSQLQVRVDKSSSNDHKYGCRVAKWRPLCARSVDPERQNARLCLVAPPPRSGRSICHMR